MTSSTMTPWSEWEDYQAGMYLTRYETAMVAESVAVLTDPERFREAAREMIREWPVAAIQNLTRMWTGRNAWVGQATCCYSHGATGLETRTGWGQMTNDQQRAANAVADAVRAEFERGRRDAQTLFAY